MSLQLKHTELDVFVISKAFVLSCYKATKSFPTEEKFALTQQIRRAALSVHLNVVKAAQESLLQKENGFMKLIEDLQSKLTPR